MTEFTGSGRLADYSRVVDLHLFLEDSQHSLTLHLKDTKSNALVELRFDNVSSLKFLGDGTRLHSQMVLLLVEQISSRGWERVHFAVKDVEEEFLSFYCERIERR